LSQGLEDLCVKDLRLEDAPGRRFVRFPDVDPPASRPATIRRLPGMRTQTGAAFDDMPVGSLPAATRKTMRFTGITVLKVENGLITEGIGLDDGLMALRQLGLITGT
jgi:hypothetical protein